ncbi:Methylated-DNA--protein-cysteine methyltransferase [subsurface metagenome]
MKNIYVSYIKSDIGNIFIASSDKGLIKVDLDCGEEDFIKSLENQYSSNSYKLGIVFNYNKYNSKIYLSNDKNKKILNQIKSYLIGDLEKFNINIDIKVTDFQKKVLNAVRNIKYGKTKSYSQIAKEIKKPRAYRAVGNAISKNPIPIVIPCHRVIKSDGSIGGFGGRAKRIDIKRKLLEIEDLKI